MAKGTLSKQTIAKKIMEVFSGAFEYNGGKEIRIPMQEDGQEIQHAFQGYQYQGNSR